MIVSAFPLQFLLLYLGFRNSREKLCQFTTDDKVIDFFFHCIDLVILPLIAFTLYCCECTVAIANGKLHDLKRSREAWPKLSVVFRNSKWTRVKKEHSTTLRDAKARLTCLSLLWSFQAPPQTFLLASFCPFLPPAARGLCAAHRVRIGNRWPGDGSKMILSSTRKIMIGGWLSPKACSPRWDWRRLQDPCWPVSRMHIL